MSEYVSISEVVEVASGAAGCKYQLIPGKKIMFESRLENGESIAMCTPQSKFHPQGFYWTDITSVQYELLDSYDNAIVIFRLQGRMLTMLNWEDLKPYFTAKCMRNNSKEGNHWKLNIYTDHIKVSGNENEIKVNAIKYTGK